MPEAIAVPALLGRIVPPVNTTCPSALTVIPEAWSPPPPVSNCGKDMGEIPGSLPLFPGKLGVISKLRIRPCWEMRTRFCPAMAAIVMSPPGAANVPVLMTLPPSKVKLSPDPTVKLPELIMLPGLKLSNLNSLGVPTKVAQLLLPIALSQLLLPKPTPLAVVAVKEAGTFKLAFGPKTMPAGLIKNKLELPPVIWIKPLM